ncbi:hypothetical protein [Arthrobacter sp. STN4]|uniref:hypothetical protein n=1 Tax=Arthrobacter sp. STN4 TaxID=2923276 RepID=UPI00211A061B|nr:hypothetical protein [Arthrobacter sp. STN4]MCQ9162966.1 hypothetical protein [Arthrobacter sp. STN4]
MFLVDFVRVVGVAFGLWGAILTVPGAAKRVGRDFATLSRRVWAWVRRRQSVNVHAGAARGTVTFGTPIAIGESRLPSPLAGEVGAQIEQLRAFANGLAGRVTALQRDLAEQINALRHSLDALRLAHDAAMTKLEAERRQADQSTLTINARGLPLIGLSILLSGLPDTWIVGPWVAWFLLASAALLTIITIVRLLRPQLLDS